MAKPKGMTRLERLKAMKIMEAITRKAKNLPNSMIMKGALYEILTICDKELNGTLDEFMAEHGIPGAQPLEKKSEPKQ